MGDAPAVRVEAVGRVYRMRGRRTGGPRALTALEDVRLDVAPGELFGVLGPNGAGKTTLIKILTTLLAPTTGRARVAGFDVVEQAREVRERISMVAGGESSGYGMLTVRENLWMFAQFYGLTHADTRARIDALLKRLGLLDRARTKMSTLSTGLRQKVNIIRGFLTDPAVLFLDEPSLGLDVNAARDVRALVRDWMADDPTRTVVLTTHTMQEADELCDRIAIINHGRVLACDTPARLKQHLQRAVVYHIVSTPLAPALVDDLRATRGVRTLTHLGGDGRATLEAILESEEYLGALITLLTARDARLINLVKREPTLEDVFVTLVGRSMSEEETESRSA